MISERPVIASGCGIPSRSSAVGATSARMPPSRSSRPSAVTISGTGLSEWAVLGEPSGSSMWSQLPWSAVTMQAPPLASTAATTSPRQASTVSTAVTAAGITPVCPTMSGLAKLMIPKR